jgi:hypothetical protein|tara:strand:+ start:24940 stop:25320 length:381 start_codon:yes stop_codon:yes gene_type:complete
MKQLILILSFPIIGFGQTVVDTCFTEQQIHDISETLDDLYYKDSVNIELINQQTAVINKQDELIKLDSMQLVYKQQQIDLLESNIDLYVEQQKKLQPKWYNNKALWFGAGIITTVLTGKLIVEVIQ